MVCCCTWQPSVQSAGWWSGLSCSLPWEALTPTELRWRYALRSGAAPLSDVQSIRCSKVSRRGGTVDVATVEFTGRGRLKFLGRTPGLAEFQAKIHDTAPQVSVESPVR